MVGKSKPANAEEQKRMALIKEQGWCIPCTLLRLPNRPFTTIQHVVEGNKRLGHRFTYGSCPWHHLGHVVDGYSRQEMLTEFGVSLAHSRKEFRVQFAPERDLVKLQDRLIERFAKDAWNQYDMPHHVVYEIQTLWHELRERQ